MNPTVSVILCCYNQGPWVAQAVESVLSQTYPNIELIAIDNGSADNSKLVLQSFAARPNVKLLLHETNEFPTKRLNQGIRESSGEFISILYADDYYLPQKIERQMEAFASLAQDFGVVYSPGYRLHVANGQQSRDASLQKSGNILEDLLLRHEAGYINPISPLIGRACALKYPYDESLFVEGESINLQYAMTYRYHYLDEPLVVMRDHETNLGKSVIGNTERLMTVLDRLEQHPDFPPAQRGNLETFRARMLRNAGWQCVRVFDDPNRARSMLRQATRVQAKQWFHPRTLGGFVLSWLPSSLRSGLNRSVAALR